MALRNGLLLHGPTHWAAAVRDKQGGIQVASGRKPRVRGVDNVPGVRGVVRLGEAFAVIPLVKRALPAAKLPFEDRKSTRLNSSHANISYAVFCLKKKNM